MKPKIEKTQFGSITITGEEYEHDVIIRLNGKVEKRKKKLSKAIYGTSHILSLAEAEYVYEDGAKWMIIGTGQSGMVTLSDDAARFFKEQGCKVIMLPTPEAIHFWNESEGAGISLFHVTC
ncbi:MAG: Mth938-like domain-containing protein [Anaerolineaceae bacterium]